MGNLSRHPVCSEHGIMTFGRFSSNPEYASAHKQSKRGFSYYCDKCAMRIKRGSSRKW